MYIPNTKQFRVCGIRPVPNKNKKQKKQLTILYGVHVKRLICNLVYISNWTDAALYNNPANVETHKFKKRFLSTWYMYIKLIQCRIMQTAKRQPCYTQISTEISIKLKIHITQRHGINTISSVSDNYHSLQMFYNGCFFSGTYNSYFQCISWYILQWVMTYSSPLLESPIKNFI